MSQITAVQALVKVMKDWPEGEKLHGYQIHDRVIRTLKQNGSPKMPMDGTTTRNLRKWGWIFGINVIDSDTSLYLKNKRPV